MKLKRKRRQVPAPANVPAKPRRSRKRRRAATAASTAQVEVEPEVKDNAEEADEEEGEEEEEEKDIEISGEAQIEMEFDFHEPDESDFHAVKDLLKSGTWEFVGDCLNLSELADSVVGQGNIGTIIKSAGIAGPNDDDNTSCGLLTTLNLRQFSHLSWAKAIQNSLLSQAAQHAGAEVSKSLKDLLAKQGKGTEVGILLNERFVNLPEELIPPLHKALKEDIEWSCSTPECPKDERPYYFFTHFICVSKCFLSSAAAARAGIDTTAKIAQADGPFFQVDEVEAYTKRALWVFTFPVSKAATSKRKKGDLPTPDGRAVFAITRKSLDQVVKDLNKALK